MVYGARIIAQALQDLGVQVVFGLPGLPVIDIFNECSNLGIRFVAFRNEQAAVYGAGAYGYLTGKPGVCISVGGPGVYHVMAGIPHAASNSWPLLVLAGSHETHNAGKGAFQETDAIALLTGAGFGTKLAVRPPNPETLPKYIRDAYRTAIFGRPGPTFVDLPANLIMGHHDVERQTLSAYIEAPKSLAPKNKIQDVVQALQTAKAPLVVIGKGAAYARAESQLTALVDRTGIPFVPTPMGKGVIRDSHPSNISAARSTALKTADVVLLLGAKLNWILSFGLAPKWNPAAKIIQVDISAEELGRNGGDPNLSIVGDIALVVEQIVETLGSWRWHGQQGSYYQGLKAAMERNEGRAAKRAAVKKMPLTYEYTYDTIKKTFDSLSDPADGNIVYVSEGANAMDIARSIFTMEHPRIRLDAGTNATMGVGMGYAIASYAAYNFFPQPEGVAGKREKKKIVAIEGDSAFGFSFAEIETISRYRMDILIFVMNNSGLYRGDADQEQSYRDRQTITFSGDTAGGTYEGVGGKGTSAGKGLSATALGYETDYQKLAEMVGGVGFLVRTPEELVEATKEGFKSDKPVIVNVIIDPQADLVMDFSWLDMAPPSKEKQSKL